MTINLAALTYGEIVYANGDFNYFNGTGLIKINTGIAAAKASILSLTSKIATLAPLMSPPFTGAPKAPTPVITDNSTTIATTAFVQALMASIPSSGMSISGVTAISYASGTLTMALIDGSSVAFAGGVVR
jgi:hypothetical protein